LVKTGGKLGESLVALRSFYARKRKGEKGEESMRKQDTTGFRNEKGRRKGRRKAGTLLFCGDIVGGKVYRKSRIKVINLFITKFNY